MSSHSLQLKQTSHLFFIGFGVLIAITLGLLAVIKYAHAVEPTTPTIVDDEHQYSEPMHITPPASAPVTVIHVPILMYHYVEHVKDRRDTMRQKLNINPEILDQQLKTLDEAGYTYLFMNDIAEAIDQKKPLPPKPVVLTFDDGYADFYTGALPILEKHHAKATAYIITEFLGRPNYMTLKQLQTVQQTGLIEIGAHTQHHIDLSHASVMKQTEEIAGSKKTLDALFPNQVFSFAYPSGRFNQDSIKIVREAGFTTAVSTNPGTEIYNGNRFVLFRLRPGSRLGKDLIEFLDRMEK